jgi:hypothetical protein
MARAAATLTGSATPRAAAVLSVAGSGGEAVYAAGVYEAGVYESGQQQSLRAAASLSGAAGVRAAAALTGG